jgi:hypothetical protein
MAWQGNDHKTPRDDNFSEQNLWLASFTNMLKAGSRRDSNSEINDEGRSKITCHVPPETLCMTDIFKSNIKY